MSAAQVRILAVLAVMVATVGIATAVVFYLGDRERLPAPRAAVSSTPPPSPAAPPGRTASAPAGVLSTGTASPSTRTVTPAPSSVRRLTVRATSAINVRAGPGTSFNVVGALQPGEVAQVLGRDSAADWLMIEQPGGAGWVAAGIVDVTGDVSLAPVVGPGAAASPAPSVTPTVPRTATPTVTATAARTLAPSTPTVSPTATPTAPRLAAALPDIALQEVAATQGGRVSITIANAGTGPLTGRRISVVALDEAASVVLSEVTAPLTIAPGAATTVELSYRLSTSITLTIILNADGSIEESNQANNRRRATLSPR